MLRPLRCFLFGMGLAVLMPLSNASAQLVPHAATDQEQFVSYWTTEGNWDSELQLRNNQKSRVLTVTPVLRTADGKETTLSAVTINPQEVKSFDINAALQTVAPQLMAAYGSVVLRYHSTDAQNLYAVLMLHDVGHPIVWHIDGRVEDTYETASREGVWWLPTASTNDYLILTNYGQDPMAVDLSLYDAAGKEVKQAVNLGPAQTIRYSVRQLIQARGLGGSYGGIKVFASAHADSLDTLHALFDEKAGFSAFLKMFDHDPNAKIEERDFARTAIWTLRAPMLALSHPDPALGFPEGTTLQPQIFVRNTTPKPLNVALRFNWRGDGTTGKASGPALRLAPYETRRVDIGALQDGKILPSDAHWSSVTLTSDGKPDEVMAVAASYDSSLEFGAQTPFSDTLNFQWEGNAWEYDAHHNSIITAGNGGTKPTRAAFTIFYNQGAEKYELEQTLQPDEQMWIDVGSLIRNRTQDKNGKALPLDVGSGSYEFRDLTDHGVGSLFEGKVVYDTTYGQVTYGCASCCGYYTPVLLLNPLGIPLQFTAGNGVQAWSTCDGSYMDVTGGFDYNWSTANPSIARVDSYGTHTGMAVGSTTSQTYGYLQRPSLHCPLFMGHPQGGDNVQPVISGPNTVWYFGGQNPSGYATSITLTSSGGSATTWAVTAGSNMVNLSTATGAQTTVTSTGTAFSSSSGDIGITATANNVPSAVFAITSRKPYEMISAGSPATTCDPSQVYISKIFYTIRDQLHDDLPANVPQSEAWTTGVVNDYSGANWPRGNAIGSVVGPVGWFDEIGAYTGTGATPTANCNGPSTAVQHWGQEWRFGSTTSGVGQSVQTDTIQKYINHAEHQNVISPD